MRPDISNNLIHFTKGPEAEAFPLLQQIIAERSLRGGNGMIRGGHRCVCFTEAPLHSLENGLVNPFAYARYAPFGIVTSKRYLFAQGGRPAIYQSDEEYDLLSDDQKWRHVRYEPNGEPMIDFSWEREWRITQ